MYGCGSVAAIDRSRAARLRMRLAWEACQSSKRSRSPGHQSMSLLRPPHARRGVGARGQGVVLVLMEHRTHAEPADLGRLFGVPLLLALAVGEDDVAGHRLIGLL